MLPTPGRWVGKKDDLRVGVCTADCAAGKEQEDIDIGEVEREADEDAAIEDGPEIDEDEDDVVVGRVGCTGDLRDLNGAGIRMVFWWKVPLVVSKS